PRAARLGRGAGGPGRPRAPRARHGAGGRRPARHGPRSGPRGPALTGPIVRRPAPALDYVWYGRCARPPRKAVPGRSERAVPREAGEQRTNPGRINQYAHRVADTEAVLTAMGCLSVNAWVEPLTILPVRRALRLVIDRKAEILEIDEARVFRSERREMPCPSVIRLVRYVHVPRKFRRQVTNTFLFARDNYSCEYCGRHRS